MPKIRAVLRSVKEFFEHQSDTVRAFVAAGSATLPGWAWTVSDKGEHAVALGMIVRAYGFAWYVRLSSAGGSVTGRGNIQRRG